MAQFATHDEFGARIGLTLTSDEQTRADTLLTMASGLIQEETKQKIELVTDDSYSRPGSYDTRVRLPERPVVSVSAVTLNGTALVPGQSYFVDRDELCRMNWNSVVQDSSFGLPWAGWGFPWWTLAVVYTHGYATIPQLVKTVTMEAVARVWANPGAVIQETIAGVQTTYAPFAQPPRGLLLTDSEKKELNKLLRKHSSSIALR